MSKILSVSERDWDYYYKYKNKCLICKNVFELYSEDVVDEILIQEWKCPECGEMSTRKRSI